MDSISRRAVLGMLAASTSPFTSAAHANISAPKKTALGLVLYCCRFRRDMLGRENPKVDLYEPQRFLEHCRQLGAGGMQASLGVLDANAARALRQWAEDAELFIEAIINPPGQKQDLERFEAQMKTAAAVGAKAVRTVFIPGRRYEFFESLEQFREYEARGRRALELAAPIAEKLRLPLAVENHKDHRNVERVALFEHIGSEYVGACVDTGNSVALLEDAVETAEALAPWAHSVHLKDQAVQEYEDGFLLGDIPLGQGFLDLKRIVDVLRRRKPQIRFTLELITRDPLKVPVLTEKYWATFPDVPARDLARMLKAVRAGAAEMLQQVESLSAEEQVALEDANVRASLDYARAELGL